LRLRHVASGTGGESGPAGVSEGASEGPGVALRVRVGGGGGGGTDDLPGSAVVPVCRVVGVELPRVVAAVVGGVSVSEGAASDCDGVVEESSLGSDEPLHEASRMTLTRTPVPASRRLVRLRMSHLLGHGA
jgi:hypothetical protein